jgi:MFS family permease
MLGNGALARAQLSFGAAWAAEWAFTVGLGLVAYADAGAKAVGLVGVLRLVPAAVLAPPIGALADRAPRERVLIASSATRAAVTLVAAAVLAADGPLAIVYALAVASTIAFTPFRATHSALLPSLCRTPEELTTSNVVRGALDSLSLVLGTFVAALLVAVAHVWAVFALAGGLAALSAALLVALEYERMARPEPPVRRRIATEVREGVEAIRAAPGLALVVGLTTLQTAIRGALSVFVVVVALSLLDLGASGVGWLQGVVGLGALTGSLLVGRLITAHAAARWLAVGVGLWGAPLILIGALPHTAVAVLALVVIGVANAIVDVGAFTIPGRMVADKVLARVYSVLESAIALGVAVGALLAPAAIALLGSRGALVAVGVTAPTASALSWLRLARIDEELSARAVDIGLLRRVPMLQPLPASVVEQIARHTERIELSSGATAFVAGDVGDRFYVIEQGRISIRDGGAEVRTLGPGEGFGEIALLRDVPRTMTAVAVDDVTLRAIARPRFLEAVTGFASAGTLAAATVAQHLERAPGRDGDS